MNAPRYPLLLQVNTRVLLTDLSGVPGRSATLDDIPDTRLDEWRAAGWNWIWLLSVWTTGETGRRISQTHPEWQPEFKQTLPDLTAADIGGSGFAIADYAVSPDLGGPNALARFRERLSTKGMKLMLDFVPNHMGPDHPWVAEHPEYFVAGAESDPVSSPKRYFRTSPEQGDRVLAFGRDPYFDSWPDTVQLDYSQPATGRAMQEVLMSIAGMCDGVRCDMAMLILPEVFERTWGRRALPFWPHAIAAVRAAYPEFRFMAEVYWDMEWTLQQQGFDYTYDKRLYDRLTEGLARPVREHFYAGLDFQDKLVRFLENHDEPRAAATFAPAMHRAAAVITYLSPGLRFFYDGQLEGRRIKVSPHLVRAPEEHVDKEISTFYDKLIGLLQRPVFRDGAWRQLGCTTAWGGNESWDAFLAWAWEDAHDRVVIAVNYEDHQSQCYVRLPFNDLAGVSWRLTDLLGDAIYDRDGDDLHARGLYLDMPPWGHHVFHMHRITP